MRRRTPWAARTAASPFGVTAVQTAGQPGTIVPTRRDLPAEQALVFEPIERRVERAAGDAAIGAGFELPPDPDARGVRAEPENGQQHELLELSNVDRRLGHWSTL